MPFKLSADMCLSGTDRSSTLVDSSPLPPDVSNCAFLFILVFCQAVKTFTSHFVLYLVFLGTVSDSKEISSFSVFGGRKRAVARLRYQNKSTHVTNPASYAGYSCTVSSGTYSILASIYCFPFASR